MRRALRRAALAAAGLLPAAAAAAPPDAVPPAGVRVVPGAAAARLAALQVELAWLADPVTASQPLEARAGGAALEVCGSVSDEVARERALTLARRHGGGLPILDGLTVDQTLSPRP